ncbi:uncharacterized protein LOC124413865 [Diprion similis]|uniref:uncharacterized protein LOC124413865 n=1 Tax=Diprion similis TaxID=362088 RepID=UPI001EF7FF2E|nr:uncharacterized protein LOC124413865 [Diprion similis]
MQMTIVAELHRLIRRNYPRRFIDVRGLDETWQYAWVVPIKSKSGKDVTAAIKSVLAQNRKPKHLHVDQSKEFYNSEFKALMKQRNINMYSTSSNLNSSRCEPFNQTLKNKMCKRFAHRGSHKRIDILSDLMKSYNNTKHGTIRIKQVDVRYQLIRYFIESNAGDSLPNIERNSQAPLSGLKAYHLVTI